MHKYYQQKAASVYLEILIKITHMVGRKVDKTSLYTIKEFPQLDIKPTESSLMICVGGTPTYHLQ